MIVRYDRIVRSGTGGRVKTIRCEKRKTLAPMIFQFAKFDRGVVG